MSAEKKRIGILTFHNSYNCGSMMQAYALQQYLKKLGVESEIIDFSNEGQKRLYSVFFKDYSIKNLIKNCILFFHQRKIKKNYQYYELFKRANFILSKNSYEKEEELIDEDYDYIICGSDQIWNITIADSDDAYFLPWVKNAKKIAYAPSFGAKNIVKYAQNVEDYKAFLQDFDSLSIREDNGQIWLKDLIGKNIPVVLDPTLLLAREDYEKIINTNIKTPEKYIFYYSPGYSKGINRLVKKISKKYKLPVIAFNAKSFYLKGMNFTTSFQLPSFENPAVYLRLIKKATMVITTSFHGTVFSTIFEKTFWTIKNGGMFGDDDRVLSMMKKLDLEDRLVSMDFDDDFNYLQSKDYQKYHSNLTREQDFSIHYLSSALRLENEKGK